MRFAKRSAVTGDAKHAAYASLPEQQTTHITQRKDITQVRKPTSEFPGDTPGPPGSREREREERERVCVCV